MFTSRQPKPLSKKFQESVWPSMGLRRSSRYWRHRIVRLKDSNYKIAAGLAIGAAISFTPLPGTHVIGALALCLMLRANLISGFLGTLIGNPWTLPFMWWFSYWIGKITFIHFGLNVRQMPGRFEWAELVHEITHDPWPLMAPWITGGFIAMIITFPVFYVIFHWIIDHLRKTQHMWKENRLHKEARSITGQTE